MKRRLLLTIFIFIMVAANVVCFFACKTPKGKDGVADEGITISFVTGFENDSLPLVIQPIKSTLSEPGIMPKEPSRIGYKFLGWFYDEERSKPFSVNDGLQKDTILYAKWEEKRASSDKNDKPKEEIAPSGVKLAYRSDDETYAIVGYNGKEEGLVLSPVYEGKAVTAIKKGAFSGNETLKSITLSGAIVEIEGGAFYGCKNLERVNAPDSNETFTSKDGVLYTEEYNKLIVVGQGRKGKYELAKKVSSIAPYAFAGGKYEVVLKEDGELKVIDKEAFAHFNGKVNIIKNIVEIRQKAFYESGAIVTFDEDSAVEKLAIGEFDSYKGEKLVLPKSIKSISGSPFENMTAELDFSKTGIKEIGNAAFSMYKGKTLLIPYFVEKIDENAFYRCISKVVFDERSIYSVINEKTFYMFDGEVILPSSVKTVKKGAFYNMTHGKVTFLTPKAELEIEEQAFVSCGSDLEQRVKYA